MPPRRTTRSPLVLLPAAVLATTLAACATGSGTGATPPPPTGLGDGHGAIAGAAEMPEPQPHLIAIGDDGTVTALDLLDEATSEIASVEDVTSVSTDGRFVFAASGDRGELTIVDSGVWTWDHEDHFHYYRAEPRVVGTVEGDGEAVVSPGSTTTGVFFPASGEAVLLDTQGLKDGEIVETVSLTTEPHAGSVTPIGSHALLTVPGDGDAASAVQLIDAEGKTVGEPQTCPGARGAAATSVGVAIVCDDGALLAVDGKSDVSFERIPFPDGAVASPAADAFANRRGRPVVAAVAGEAGFWAFDSRAREWTFVPTEVPLVSVSAIDDTEGHVVAVTADGRVLVASADSGETLAVTEPILASSLADPALASGVTLSVDRGRAYVNAPADGVAHEIDFADGARIARTFELPQAPLFAVETGV